MSNELEVLCAKLGVAAESLWPILVEQAVFDGWAGMCFSSVLLTIFVVSTIIWCREISKNNFNELDILIFVPIFMAIASIAMIINAIKIILFPEVEALKIILGG